MTAAHQDWLDERGDDLDDVLARNRLREEFDAEVVGYIRAFTSESDVPLAVVESILLTDGWPTYDDLTEQVGASTRTVRTHVLRMEEEGLVKVIRSSGPARVSITRGGVGTRGRRGSETLADKGRRMRRENVYLAANISSKDLDEEIDHYSRIVEILEDRRERIQAGEDLDTFVMVVDEAAQIFTGSGSDQHKAKQLAKLLKLARKANANLILIGQDGKDIDASLRALCTLFIHKESTKKATLYHDVKDRKGIGEMMSLSGIPQTDLDFSTWDEGDFVFDADEDDEDDGITDAELEKLIKTHKKEMMAILDLTTEMTQNEIAEIYGYSDGKAVRRAKADCEDKLREMGLLDNDE